MIHILDEIVIAPQHIPTVLNLLESDYLPGLPARQSLRLQQRWVSPPVSIPGMPNRLWLLWEVDSAYGYYGMRGTAGEEVARFWQAVDALCETRHRHVMSDAQQPLPALREDA